MKERAPENKGSLSNLIDNNWLATRVLTDIHRIHRIHDEHVQSTRGKFGLHTTMHADYLGTVPTMNAAETREEMAAAVHRGRFYARTYSALVQAKRLQRWCVCTIDHFVYTPTIPFNPASSFLMSPPEYLLKLD